MIQMVKNLPAGDPSSIPGLGRALDVLTMPKPLTVWITMNCGKFFKRWEYQTT